MNEEKKKAVTALKTTRGQIDGIIKMIEDGRYCIDVSNQIMAAGKPSDFDPTSESLCEGSGHGPGKDRREGCGAH